MITWSKATPNSLVSLENTTATEELPTYLLSHATFRSTLICGVSLASKTLRNRSDLPVDF